jgi:hypothetical protein
MPGMSLRRWLRDGLRQRGKSDPTAGSDGIDLFEVGGLFEWRKDPAFGRERWGNLHSYLKIAGEL